MPRGGARPGAGRKPKAKPEAPPAAPQVAIAPAGVKPAGSETWPFGVAQEDAAPETRPSEQTTPLDYLLGVMRDSSKSESQRMQAAALAAPYMHAKPAPGGKKVEKAGAAKQAAGGKFAAAAPPRLVSSR